MENKRYFVVCLVLSLLIPASVFAWGSATHAYYANELGRGSGYLNLQEMYGAMLPDMFAATFGSPYFDYLWSQSHEQFQKVVKRAKTKDQKAFAFGYASHNDVWGADYTAHHNGRTTPGIGYVYARIAELTAPFEAAIEQILLDNNMDPAQAKAFAKQFAPSVAHEAVETAVDILIKRNEDPNIGARIISAAQLRSAGIPLLLVGAYATDFDREFDLNWVQAAGIIVGAEAGFREVISYYGYMLMKEETKMIQLLSVYGAELAEQLMKAATNLKITVPPEAIDDLLVLTINHVESDYADEVAATLAYLETELPSHSIEAQSQPVVLNSEVNPENVIESAPHEFSLAQNYPNPFNPTTTISYSLATDSHIKITIYNSIGQVVAVLVDEFQAQGSHSVKWDASDQPSGIYVYRLEADGFIATRKMFLQK